MRDKKTFLFATFILAIVSVANADLSLTVNGLDAAKEPLEIKGKDNLVIDIEGVSDDKTQDISVTCNNGNIEPLKKPGKYLFTFTDELKVGTISLNVGKEIVYQLILFYISETDTVIIFGLDKEDLAPPKPKPGPKLESKLGQQIATLQTAEPEKSYSAGMSAGQAAGIEGFPEPNSYPDINNDKIVNFIDFAKFANNWQKSGSDPDGDFDESGTVDTNDLATFAYFWLNGPHPVDVSESFKAALSAGDVNEALTFVTQISRDKYAEIFQIIEPNLPDYAAGMDEMIFDWQKGGKVKYEMLHQDGGETYSFPVFFIKDENGNWKIYNF